MKATIGKLRQVLSMVLAVIMLLSMVPALNISAAETESAELSADVHTADLAADAETADLSAEVPAAELTADTSLAEVADGTTADGFEYRVSDNEVEIIGYIGSETELTIPSTIDEYPVASIDEYAFFECTSLTSVIIPNSVTSIGRYAFVGCTSLERAIISEGVTNIDYGAFYKCTSLNSITIPKGVTNIGWLVFYGCTSLESIVIPEGVTSIDDSAFYGCTSLSDITLPESVTSIGEAAFNSCKSLSNITIPEGVTSIDCWAFCNCTSLESIIIPSSVTNINSYVFSECTSLESITIPYSVTSIDAAAFDECESLVNVYITDLDAWFDIEFGGYSSQPLYYGGKLFLDGEIVEDLVIPDGVTYIGDFAFYGCTSIKSVVIPEYVTSIGYSTFYGCTSLESITISDGVKSIGDLAFYCCESIESIIIPEGVTSIGVAVFENCTSLESVTIPNGVTSIGDFAFEYCESLLSITIPEGVESIGHGAFFCCISLESVYIADLDAWLDIDFKSYNSNPLCNGSKLYLNGEVVEEVIIPSDVTSIDDYVFDGCTSLKCITIPSSVKSIGYYAFNACTNLTHVFYAGKSGQWNKISIEYGNYVLNNWEQHTTFHYKAKNEGFKFSHTIIPSCIKDGADVYACSVCGEQWYKPIEAAGHKFEDGLCTNCNVEKALLIESDHPYENNMDKSWTISQSGAKSISIIFSKDTKTEDNKDYIYIYNSGNTQFEKYSGNELAGETITISGDTACIQLVSDGNYTDYGFAIVDVIVDYEGETTEPTEPTQATDPTEVPTEAPTQAPTEAPTEVPTDAPTQVPTEAPTEIPTDAHTQAPTEVPTEVPTTVPATDVPETEITFPEEYISDEKTNVAVGGNTDKEVELKVSEVTSDKDIEDIDLILIGEKVNKVFDITLQKDGVEVQPDGKVYVRIPAENPESKVYRMETDGTLTDMNAVYVDGYLVFTTEHFSLYVVAEPAEETDDPTPPAEDEPATPDEPEVKYLIGDANGDGKINVKDATQIQKAVAGLVTLDEVGNLAADSDQNEKVNVKDATAIQKFVAGIPVDAPVGEERTK